MFSLAGALTLGFSAPAGLSRIWARGSSRRRAGPWPWALYQDYDHGSFEYDVLASGPVIGIVFGDASER